MSTGDYLTVLRTGAANGAFMLLAALGAFSSRGESNKDIAEFYRSSSSSITSKLEDGFANFHDAELRIAIWEAANIRLAEARKTLIGNLWYMPFYSAMKSRLKESPVDPIMLAGAGTFFPQGQYPAYAALMRIGVSFPAIKGQIGGAWVQERDSSATIASDNLGVFSAGNYYRHLRQGQAAISAADQGRDVADAGAGLPMNADFLQSGGGNTERVGQYNAMQATLLARFAEERNSASTNLPDTIATMGFIRSLDAIPALADNLTICPQASTNAPGGYVFPAAEALIAIGPAIGDCFARLKAAKPLSVEEALWLRISHELYPEGLEYELYCAARTNDLRAARLMRSLPWRRLTEEEMK